MTQTCLLDVKTSLLSERAVISKKVGSAERSVKVYAGKSFYSEDVRGLWVSDQHRHKKVPAAHGKCCLQLYHGCIIPRLSDSSFAPH